MTTFDELKIASDALAAAKVADVGAPEYVAA